MLLQKRCVRAMRKTVRRSSLLFLVQGVLVALAGRCWETNSNSSQLGQRRCPLCRAETALRNDHSRLKSTLAQTEPSTHDRARKRHRQRPVPPSPKRYGRKLGAAEGVNQKIPKKTFLGMVAPSNRHRDTAVANFARSAMVNRPNAGNRSEAKESDRLERRQLQRKENRLRKREIAELTDTESASGRGRILRSAAGLSRRLFLASLAASATTACSAPRHFVDVAPVKEVAGRSHTIYVATVRAPSPDPAILFSGERSPNLNFAVVDVHVPPDHMIGQVELPRRLPPDPSKHFVIDNPQILDEPRFRAVVGAAALSRPRGRRDALVWIHGFNTTLSEAVLRLAQFVEDTGYRGVPLLFSWASEAKVTSYVYDINSALIARDAITYVASALGRSSFDNIDIIAHSMGNFLAMEAIRGGSQLNLFDSSGKLANVVLADPDIDYELFAAQVRNLPAEKRGFFVLISDDDRALRLSQVIARRPRVGNIDADSLTRLGVNVIDLSQVKETSSIHHTKFVDAPEVVQLLGNRLLAGDTYASQGTSLLGTAIVVGAGGALQVVE